MDHRPFEDWLLDDKSLNKEERLALQGHLETCPACAALTEVNLRLRGVKAAAPADGFTTRFQIKLEAERQKRRRRERWGFLILTLGGLGILLWIGWPLFSAVFQSPVGFLASWLASLARLYLLVGTVGEAISVLFDVIPGFIPAYVWAGVFSVFGGLGLLWVISVRKFTRIPRGA